MNLYLDKWEWINLKPCSLGHAPKLAVDGGLQLLSICRKQFEYRMSIGSA